MTESERPRRSSLRPTPAQVFDFVKWAATTLASIGMAVIATYKWVDGHATEAEVEARLAPLVQQLDEERKALEVVAAELARVSADLTDAERAVYWSYWWRAGEKAAELERDPDKRSRAVRRAHDAFDADYNRGVPAEEAYRRTLARGVP